jgi:hypothetical protein
MGPYFWAIMYEPGVDLNDILGDLSDLSEALEFEQYGRDLLNNKFWIEQLFPEELRKKDELCPVSRTQLNSAKDDLEYELCSLLANRADDTDQLAIQQSLKFFQWCNRHPGHQLVGKLELTLQPVFMPRLCLVVCEVNRHDKVFLVIRYKRARLRSFINARMSTGRH